MGHSYAVDLNSYCRIKAKVRSMVFDDADVVDGDVPFYLTWNGGYIEPWLEGAAAAIVTATDFGIGCNNSSWQIGGGTWAVDGAGALYSTSGSGTLGFTNTSDWTSRGSTFDVSWRAKVGTTAFTVSMSVYGIRIERSSLRVKFQEYVSNNFVTRFTGTTPLVVGQWHDIRVTGSINGLWTLYVDGVEQGTYTDSSGSTNKRLTFNGYDTDSKIAAVKMQPTGSCPATAVEVINDDGEAVYSAAVSSHLLTIPDSELVQGNGLGPSGGYKVRLTGASNGNYGTAKGDCQFIRIGPTINAFGPKPEPFTSTNTYETAGWDIPLRCFFGLGATRLAVSVGDVESAAQYLQDNYVALGHVARPRYVIGHFHEDDPDDTTLFESTVNSLKHVVDAWEPRNEPNLIGYGGQAWAEKQQLFYTAVKAADASAIVLGPNNVQYTLLQSGWHDDFYFYADGADWIDQPSEHGYNCTNGDIAMSRRLLETYQARPQIAGRPMWQTEQSHHSQFGNLCMPHHALRWTAVQLMVQETRGITIERNVLWYDMSHGFSYTSFWQHGNGVTSVPLLVRTMVDELGGRTFHSDYDLGAMADFYVCARWSGDDGTSTVGVLAQSIGQPDVRFYVTGAETVECCDAFGNEFTLDRGAQNIISVAADVTPTWLRVPDGVTLTIVPEWDYGTNLAIDATVTSSAASTYNAANLVSEVLENQYDRDGGAPENGAGYNFVTFNGTAEGTNTYPITVTAALAEPGVMSAFTVSAPPIWQTWFGTPTDFDIDVSPDGSSWATVLTHAPAPLATSAFVSDRNGNNSTQDTWFNPQTVWTAKFAKRFVSHVRLVVRASSWAGHETQADSQALWGPEWNPLTVRGLRLHDVPFSSYVTETLTLAMPALEPTSGGGRTRSEKAIARFNTLGREASVLKIGGQYVTVEGPTTDQLADATEVYLGGHLNAVTAAQAEALVDAGYAIRVG